MGKEYLYTIVINGDFAEPEHKFQYSYGSVKGICIQIANIKAKISFTMKTEKTYEDFCGLRVLAFKDAYLKVHMLSALLYGKGIAVKKLNITINDSSRSVELGQEDFPIVFSMLGERQLGIKAPWEAICKEYCFKTKTAISEDHRFASLYAYLLSKVREFEYDRFQNLWTAINGLYTYVAEQYEKSLKEEFGLESVKEIRNDLLISSKDGLSIGALSYIIGGNYRKITPKDAEELRIPYLETERILGKVEEETISALYDECLNALKKDSDKHSDIYRALKRIADCFEVPVYVYLLLGYPYHWRCKYLHGNYIAPLFVDYNSDELKCLRVLNYFMDKFLATEIPSVFEENYWDEDKYKAVLKMLEKCDGEAYKKYSKRDVTNKKKTK